MIDNIKKILVVDDSALMRRVLCDIINSDKRFQVTAKAADGVEAFDLLTREHFDGVVLDVNMPRMNGLELLRELNKFKIPARVLIASTESTEGAAVTLEALELGALDFVEKPGTSFGCRSEEFTDSFLATLYAVCCGRLVKYENKAGSAARPQQNPARKPTALGRGAASGLPDGAKPAGNSRLSTAGSSPRTKVPTAKSGSRIVAIASSTGGPKALQEVIPLLPRELDAPVLLVQHMPKGFTNSLALRLNDLSRIQVKEAQEGEILQKGVVYVAMGGKHMNITETAAGTCVVSYSDEPPREGVKPSANYMYESLMDTDYAEVVCVVLTGMGSDGTAGIRSLKKKKALYVITQDPDSCVVYGMPKSVVNAGLSDQETPLGEIAQRITERIGVRMN